MVFGGDSAAFWATGDDCDGERTYVSVEVSSRRSASCECIGEMSELVRGVYVLWSGRLKSGWCRYVCVPQVDMAGDDSLLLRMAGSLILGNLESNKIYVKIQIVIQILREVLSVISLTTTVKLLIN